MIIVTGSRSKKFGDICYTFVIFSTNISDFTTEHLLMMLNEKNYPIYFFLVILVNCFLHIICVYFLVGSRIHLLMTNPNYDFNDSSYGSSTDLSQYVALRSKIRSMSIFMRFRSNPSLSIRDSIIRPNNSQAKSGGSSMIIEKVNQA